MRIFLEWTDGTWKTTLAEKLSEKTWWPIVKFSQPKTDNPTKEFLEYYDPENPLYIWDNVIVDRCWISETIYGPMKWRPTMYMKDKKKFIKATKDDLYIICHTKPSNIKHVFETRWEDYIDFEEAKIINQKYLNRYKTLWKHLYMLLYNFKVDWKDMDKYYNNYIKHNIWDIT